MEVVITPDEQSAAELVADIYERALRNLSSPNLGVATGSSPLPTYAELVRRHREHDLSFSTARLFLLDEYLGLPVGHPEAYRTFIERHLAGLVDLPADALFSPDGNPDDVDAAAARYEQQIADAGGIDIQLVGIGADGHIGFNEPMSSLASRTRIKTLTSQTRSDNARFFDDDIDQVPHHVLTQGIGTILDAHHIVMIATGEGKADPIALAVEGPIAAMVPASALQLHPHVTVVVDEAAASRLSHADYYRETHAGKPAWQPH